MKLESFRGVGVEQIIVERGWESIVTNIHRFVTKVIHEFYANLSDNIVVKRENEFEKVIVKAVYDFSPGIISEYLNILVPKDFNYEKDYVLDDEAS